MLKKLFNETMQEMLEVEMDMILERCAGNGVPTLYQYYRQISRRIQTELCCL
ncbi:hypothetical protein [Pectinatus frisingensis]|uniref:hypothetical protein n=1 Tax=Pectinatus frisingensis TaxID=865 RepID=UPI0018C80764|nr:hypothetical protein [Pectinatus frisingensis]